MVNEFYKYLETDEVKTFLQNFGGEFYYGMEYGFLYQYGKDSYYLPENYKELIRDSVEKGENLMLTLDGVSW